MELNLHANATTTPKTRAYIQSSQAPVAVLANELGVSETTIRRWRARTTVADRSHTPMRLAISLSPIEEALACELRAELRLPLDDITEVMRRCVRHTLSRSAIHRCLKRHGLSHRPKPDKPPVGIFEQATVGFIHVDLKHLTDLEKRKSYAFVAIDRATRYVYLEIHPCRDGATAAGFLVRFLAHFPYPVHTLLTDNGSEFTDRFAVDMKDKPHDRPSGRHPFDRICAENHIDHRLTRPFRPQTNGLVERFNRRLVEAIGRQPKRGTAHRLFASHAERDAFLHRFVHDYNRTRLKCLGYLAPLQALNNPPKPNTKEGIGERVSPPRPRRKNSFAVGSAKSGGDANVRPTSKATLERRLRALPSTLTIVEVSAMLKVDVDDAQRMANACGLRFAESTLPIKVDMPAVVGFLESIDFAIIQTTSGGYLVNGKFSYDGPHLVALANRERESRQLVAFAVSGSGPVQRGYTAQGPRQRVRPETGPRTGSARSRSQSSPRHRGGQAPAGNEERQ